MARVHQLIVAKPRFSAATHQSLVLPTSPRPVCFSPSGTKPGSVLPWCSSDHPPGGSHPIDVVAEVRKTRDTREQGYRAQALKLFPWICGRCAREFDHTNVHGLTVHDKNHNHDQNPSDGNNRELLCFYCHDNEHLGQLDTRSLSVEATLDRGRPRCARLSARRMSRALIAACSTLSTSSTPP